MTRPNQKLEDYGPDQYKDLIRQISDKLRMAEIMAEEEHFIPEAITQEIKDIYDLIKHIL